MWRGGGTGVSPCAKSGRGARGGVGPARSGAGRKARAPSQTGRGRARWVGRCVARDRQLRVPCWWLRSCGGNPRGGLRCEPRAAENRRSNCAQLAGCVGGRLGKSTGVGISRAGARSAHARGEPVPEPPTGTRVPTGTRGADRRARLATLPHTAPVFEATRRVPRRAHPTRRRLPTCSAAAPTVPPPPPPRRRRRRRACSRSSVFCRISWPLRVMTARHLSAMDASSRRARSFSPRSASCRGRRRPRDLGGGERAHAPDWAPCDTARRPGEPRARAGRSGAVQARTYESVRSKALSRCFLGTFRRLPAGLPERSRC